MAKMSLPPGFRFHPTDVEVVKYYLKRKILGKKLRYEAIAEINIYKYAPWELPDKSCLKSRDLEWYFFCPVERKYASGARMNRATEHGYWKSTGKDRSVIHNDKTVGMLKTLVFHQGHAPKGERTDWVMYEYRILDTELADAGDVQASFVLCKVFKKSGPGPKNGAQYGAPFNDEEWDIDESDETGAEFLLPSESLPQPVLAHNSSNSVVPSTFLYESLPLLSEDLPLSASAHNCDTNVTSFFVQDSTSTGPLSKLDPPLTTIPLAEGAPAPSTEDAEVDSLIAMFAEDDPSLLFDQNGFTQEAVDEGYMELDDIFDGLGDLGDWEELSRVLR